MTQIPARIRPAVSTFVLATAGILGVLSSFIGVVAAIDGIELAGKSARLIGADNELGFPSSALSLALFVAVLAVAGAQLAGARLADGWWTALTPVLAIGVAFEVWALYLAAVGGAMTPLLPLQLLFMAAAFVVVVRRMPRDRPNAGLGAVLVVASVTGFFAAFRLTVDKVGTFIDPGTAPSCNFSVLVQCGENLSSPQGSVFGFPNPILGVGGWIAVLLVGILLLAGARMARWFWIAFNVGMLGALVLIVWLIGQSIYVIGTLCPWCMTTWVVVIPSFLLVTLYNLKEGVIPLPAGGRKVAAALYSFVPLISLLCYVGIFLIAQLQLDVVNRF